MQIKIEIDNENKQIKKFEIPAQLDPVNVLSVLNACTGFVISKIEYKKQEESKIIQENKKIIKPKILIKGNGGLI